jgi:uncharacterized protein (TIGR02391 family)
MAAAPKLTDMQIEAVSRILGEYLSGTDISGHFADMQITDTSGESTKWRRLSATFKKYQAADGTPSKMLEFTKRLLEPSRYVNRQDVFEEVRHAINAPLAFAGIEYRQDGKFYGIVAAATIDEAHKRVNTIAAKFKGRRIHGQVSKYCKAELLQDNYFHAVFEATKGLAQRIRDMSGIQLDGAALVDKVFAIDRPLLALNTLQTETEKSEHKGFALLLKGCFGAVRNPLAHEPKILWKGEDDAADYLSLISLMHRKLDDCVNTGLGGKT